MSGSVRFIHTADTQLGARFGNLPPELAELKRASQREGFAFLVSQALEKQVDLFLIAGDLFDTAKPPAGEITLVKSQLRRLQDAGIRTCMIPGNHDYYEKGNFWDQYDPWPVAKFFTENEFTSLVLDDLGVEVYGIGFDRKRSSRNALADFSFQPVQKRSILLFHGAWQNFGHDTEKDYPFSLDDIHKVPCNYIACGHYHGLQPILESPVKQAWYSGGTEGLDFSKNEIGARFAILGTIGEEGAVSVEKLKIPSLLMEEMEVDLSVTGLGGVDQLLQQKADTRTLLHLVFTGLPSADVYRELPLIEESFRHLFAWLRVSDRTLDIKEDSLDNPNTYEGIFYQALRQKLENAGTAEEREIIKQALQVGLAAFREA
ncbi:MAG TPA: DNA repair exonuclease [bacterium]|nr:DNA repair exonuclease [bacterium]